MSNAHHEDRRRIGTRLSVLQYLVVVIFSVMAVTFWVLQVVQNAKFEELAENNHQRTLALRAPRGIIFDRNGQVLVENRNSYSISIVREHTKDLNRTVRLLAGVLGLDESAVRQIVDRHRREPTYRPITIVADATLAQVAAVTARRLDSSSRRPGRAGADAPLSGNNRRPPVRLCRRSKRYAGGRRRSVEERRHRGASGCREDLQRDADGHRRRQAGGRQQCWPRDSHARRRRAGRGQTVTADARSRSAACARRRFPHFRLQRRRRHARPADGRGPRVHQRAGVRPELIRRRHRSRDVGVAQHRPVSSAAGSRRFRVAIRRVRRSKWPSPPPRWRKESSLQTSR